MTVMRATAILLCCWLFAEAVVYLAAYSDRRPQFNAVHLLMYRFLRE